MWSLSVVELTLAEIKVEIKPSVLKGIPTVRLFYIERYCFRYPAREMVMIPYGARYSFILFCELIAMSV